MESRSPSTSPRLRPKFGISGQRAHLASLCIEEAAVVGDPSISEETGQHGQRARRQSLVDERLLAVQRLNCGTTGQRVFTSLGVDDLGIQLAHGPQPTCLSSVARVQWLTENELAAGGIVAEIEPVRCAVPGFRQRPRNDASRRARVYAADQQICRPVIDPIKSSFVEVCRLGAPPRSPE